MWGTSALGFFSRGTEFLPYEQIVSAKNGAHATFLNTPSNGTAISGGLGGREYQSTPGSDPHIFRKLMEAVGTLDPAGHNHGQIEFSTAARRAPAFANCS